MASRKDKKGYALQKGEYQRADGRYVYAYVDRLGKRHFVYAKSLVELRQKQKNIQRDYFDGLDPCMAATIEVNHMVENYLNQKRNLRLTTKGGYVKTFNTYIKGSTFGTRKIVNVKYTDVKSFYYSLLDEKQLKISTVDRVHTLLHPAFRMAVRDGLIRNNPTDDIMADLKKDVKGTKADKEKRIALSVNQQKAFMKHLRENHEFEGWVPIITVLLGTWMRIGECVSINWGNLDFKNRMIYVDHEFNNRPDENGHCERRITSTKSEAGNRSIPMVQEVFDAFLLEYQFQKCIGFCEEEICGYKDFVFSTTEHTMVTPSAVNKAIAKIIKSYNAKETAEAEAEGREPFLLPHFTAHVLRHTFCTRLCEAGVNPKFIQSVMGHSDFSTTMDIYADYSDEKKQEVGQDLNGMLGL